MTDDLDDLDAPAPKATRSSPGKGHNSGARAAEDSYAVTADELRQFIERYEQLEAEKKDISDQQKEVMAEARGRGYDTKIMKKIVALRKRKPDDIAEEQAVLTIYCEAMGLEVLL